MVSGSISGRSEECRCFLRLRALQMNMTSFIRWCGGWTRCPLSFRPASLVAASLVPSRHQLAGAQVSLRHRRRCLPPSVTSLIISLRWVHYLTRGDEEGMSARTHVTHRHKLSTSAMRGKWPPWETHTHTHYKHTRRVCVYKRLRASTLGRSRSVNIWASFVKIIIEMKAEWWNAEW